MWSNGLARKEQKRWVPLYRFFYSAERPCRAFALERSCLWIAWSFWRSHSLPQKGQGAKNERGVQDLDMSFFLSCTGNMNHGWLSRVGVILIFLYCTYLLLQQVGDDERRYARLFDSCYSRTVISHSRSDDSHGTQVELNMQLSINA